MRLFAVLSSTSTSAPVWAFHSSLNPRHRGGNRRIVDHDQPQFHARPAAWRLALRCRFLGSATGDEREKEGKQHKSCGTETILPRGGLAMGRAGGPWFSRKGGGQRHKGKKELEKGIWGKGIWITLEKRNGLIRP